MIIFLLILAFIFAVALVALIVYVQEDTAKQLWDLERVRNRLSD